MIAPEAQKIINALRIQNYGEDAYVFQVLNTGMTAREEKNRIKQFIKNTNKWIKVIAEKLGINPNITTYFGRHSYATILMKQNVPLPLIQETLSHHNITTTQRYLDSFGNEEIDKANEGLL